MGHRVRASTVVSRHPQCLIKSLLNAFSIDSIDLTNTTARFGRRSLFIIDVSKPNMPANLRRFRSSYFLYTPLLFAGDEFKDYAQVVAVHEYVDVDELVVWVQHKVCGEGGCSCSRRRSSRYLSRGYGVAIVHSCTSRKADYNPPYAVSKITVQPVSLEVLS
jgi:hypothetical protein